LFSKKSKTGGLENAPRKGKKKSNFAEKTAIREISIPTDLITLVRKS
jgi:hypothetical protein